MSKTASQAAREKRPCALCGIRRSSPKGEHVLPLATIGRIFPAANSPYTSTLGTRETRRQQFDSIKLDCCSTCNDTLARRFENTGQAAGERLLTSQDGNVSDADVDQAALWLLKTWLLLSHPMAEYKLPVPRPDPWLNAPTALFRWMVDGTAPPNGLTLWGHHVPVETPGLNTGTGRVQVALPTIVSEDEPVRFYATKLRILQVVITLAYHPRWPVSLHSCPGGGPRKLWPVSSDPIHQLPTLSEGEIDWIPGAELRFLPNTYGIVDLPPLCPGTPPEEIAAPYLMGASAPPVAT